LNKLIGKLEDILTNSTNFIAFTGAGLSTESGIPTYRGVGGLWMKYDPNKYANFHYFLKNPSYYWNFFREVRYPVIKQARPNAAHYALVKMEREGKLNHVITQNIDGLHQKAGQLNVIELHGNTREILCMDCSKIFSIEEVYKLLDQEFPPKCSNCRGILRPNTVLFGESLPQKLLNEAMHLAQNCDLFFVLGSSLVVSPAAQIPKIAKDRGAALVIINLDKTPLDDIADLVIHDKVSNVLSKII